MGRGVELKATSDALAALDEAVQTIRAAEIGQAIAIVQLCETYWVSEEQLVEGCEQLKRYGAAGTPPVGEFLVAEIAPILGVSVEAARSQLADLLNLKYRHPRLHAAVLAGRVRVWQAQVVARRTAQAGLGEAAADEVDRRTAQALAVQPVGRVLRQVDRWIIDADPGLAVERARRAAAVRDVRLSGIVDGQVDVWARLDSPDGIALDQALNSIADHLATQPSRGVPAAGADGQAGAGADAVHPPESVDAAGYAASGGGLHPLERGVLRSRALGVLARHALGQGSLPDQPATLADQPGGLPDRPATLANQSVAVADQPADRAVSLADQAGGLAVRAGGDGRAGGRVVPARSATLYIHVDAATLSRGAGAADVERWGAVTVEQLRVLLDGVQVTARPVLDAAVIDPVDRHDPSPAMVEAVRLRDQVDRFPFGILPARLCDLDHTDPFCWGGPAGQTWPGNLGVLSRFSHRLKTHGGWRLEQPQPGVFYWVSPHGYRYRVDSRGTTLIGRPPRASGPARPAAGEATGYTYLIGSSDWSQIDLSGWVDGPGPQDPAFWVGLAEALWAEQAQAGCDEEWLARLLATMPPDPHPGYTDEELAEQALQAELDDLAEQAHQAELDQLLEQLLATAGDAV